MLSHRNTPGLFRNVLTWFSGWLKSTKLIMKYVECKRDVFVQHSHCLRFEGIDLSARVYEHAFTCVCVLD